MARTKSRWGSGCGAFTPAPRSRLEPDRLAVVGDGANVILPRLVGFAAVDEARASSGLSEWPYRSRRWRGRSRRPCHGRCRGWSAELRGFAGCSGALSISVVRAAACTSGVTPACAGAALLVGRLCWLRARREPAASAATATASDQGLSDCEASAGFYCRVLRQASGLSVAWHGHPIRWSDGAAVGSRGGSPSRRRRPAARSRKKISAELPRLGPSAGRPAGNLLAMITV